MTEEPFEVIVQPATKHYGPPVAYKNNTDPRGAVFIANYKKFDKGLRERTGTEVNVNQLKKLFTQMNYEVETLDTSGTCSDTIEAIKNFSQLETLKKADSLVVIFSSHGQEDMFYTSDGELIHFKVICQMFNDANCPHLIGKPKIFMFQFCRCAPRLKKACTIGTESIKTRRLTSTHICLATSEGQEAYREDSIGALFFHHICKVFMENAKDTDLVSLMRTVTGKLPQNQPAEMTTIDARKSFYFNPPLIQQGVMLPDSANVPSEPQITTVQIQRELSNLQIDGVDKITGYPKGNVLIINNLDGCKGDVDRLSDIFHQLGFNILLPVNNVSHEEMRRHFENFKKVKHFDAAIIIIYGYGFEDHIMSIDNKPMNYREIAKTFNDKNCSELEGKPKIFFINSCCIEQEEIETSNSRLTEDESSGDATASKLADKDTIIYGVEVEGGNCEQGSLLTDALYQVLLPETSTQEELFPLLRIVSDTLEKLSENREEKYYVVTYNFRFEKDFYFTLSDKTFDVLDTPSPVKPLVVPKTRRRPPRIPKTSVRHGQAIIICFSGYKSKQLPKRCGLFEEVTMYKQVVEALGYNTKFLKNCDQNDIKDSLKSFDGLEAIDSLMVIFFGFSQDVNTLYDVEGEVLPVSDIFDIFSDANCPAMKGKPKLFFFHMNVFPNLQACNLLPISKNIQEAFVYFLVSSVSANDDNFINAGLDSIYEAMESRLSTTDLESMIREAEEQLSKRHEKQYYEGFILMPISLRKEFFFSSIPVSNQ